MSRAEGEEAPRDERKSKVPWERPSLTLLGNVKELIRASGKGSALPDQGPDFRKDING